MICGHPLVSRTRVTGRQPGELRVYGADHRPDGGDACLEVGRIRMSAVGLELVDGLGDPPEREEVYRTHRRIVAA